MWGLEELIVFTPFMAAFCTFVEFGRSFIGRTSLLQSSSCFFITAFWTLNPNQITFNKFFRFLSVYDDNIFLLYRINLLKV